MNNIALISREPKLRRVLSKYLKGRKEFQSSYVSYDDAIESLDLSSTEILIVDIQGIPRGQTAISITGFTKWLSESTSTEQCAVIYLLRKGIRKPKLNYSGPIVKKPFPLERIGETIRFLRDERATLSIATTLCLNSDLASKITLQPIKRFGFDGAVIFSDILILPYGVGQKVEFEKNFGPKKF